MVAFDDEAFCPICRYLDTTHPDVRCAAAQQKNSAFWLSARACKCKTVEAKRQRDEELRHIQANLPRGKEPRTFGTFRVRQGTADALDAARKFAEGEGQPLLVLVGETGTGKSHLLEAIGRHILGSSGWRVRYDTASGYLDRLKECIGENAEMDMQELLAWYQACPIMLLDDLGAENVSGFTVERLTALVDERLRTRGRLAIATNLTAAEMARHGGERLASRIFQTNAELDEVRRVTITAPDYRRSA